MLQRGSIILLGLILLNLAAFVGCTKTESQPNEQQLRNVKLALNWFPDSQHGGFYAAQLEGFYAAEGLDVEIIPGGPGTPVIQQLMLGRADFAVINADMILEGNAQDAKIVAVMAPLQNSPRCIMVHQSSGITTFEQLNDPQITLLLGSGKPFVDYLKKHVDLSKTSMNQYDGKVNSFLQNKNIAQQAYVFSEPFLAAKEGAETNCLLVSELGYNPYTSCVATAQNTIDQDPEIVRAFVKASIRGWQKYIEDCEKTNAEMVRINPRMDLESLRFGAESMKSLCIPSGATADVVGQMDKARWETLCGQLRDLDLVPSDFQADKSYSLNFLSEPAVSN